MSEYVELPPLGMVMFFGFLFSTMVALALPAIGFTRSSLDDKTSSAIDDVALLDGMFVSV